MPSHSSETKPPYPLLTHFPSRFERRLYRFYDGVENRLWPVRPSLFSASVAAATAIHLRFPHNAVLSVIPSFGDSNFSNWLRTAVAAFGSAYLPVFILRSFLRYFYFGYKGYLFEHPKKPSLLTKAWGGLRALLLKLSPPQLRSCDHLLPPLGVPPLEQTVSSYLRSIQHLHSNEEFEAIVQRSEEFLQNEGRTLQRYAWLYSQFTNNYVTGFWEKYAYLYNRECLMITSSVAHVDLFQNEPATQAVRAAHVIYIELLSQLGIDHQAYKPLGDGLICSSHYDKMYAVTRIPGEKIDHLKNYGISKHVAVIYNGGIYKLEFTDANNRIYTIDELTNILLELLSREGTAVKGAAARIPALTHDKRDQWARNRQRFFLNNEKNRKALYDIESAAFVVILDDCEYDYIPENPEKLSGFMKAMLTGDGANRWVDKSLNYIISKNARVWPIKILFLSSFTPGTFQCGGTTEHSIADGSEFDHIMENFVKMDNRILGYPPLDEQIALASNFSASEAAKSGLKFAERLDIQVTAEMASEIQRCYETYSVSRADVDLAATIFTDFGKGRIKECGLSPDAFVQMAIQIANFRDQGKISLTYEAASARFFANSRTETLRTVSEQSCAFVQAMHDSSVDRLSKRKLLLSATEMHTARNKECMVNKGVDRHLFVLFVLSQGTGISSPFLNHYIQQPWLLSTSHVPNVTGTLREDSHPNESWLGACFGAVAKEGYGICYRFAGNHSICSHITSFHSASNTDSRRFQVHFTDALKDMSALFG